MEHTETRAEAACTVDYASDKICQVCGESLCNGEVVYCAMCNTPHHKDCWRFVGQCSTFACGCYRCVGFPVSDGSVSDDDVLTIDNQGRGFLKGNTLRLNYRPRLEPSIVNRAFGRVPSSDSDLDVSDTRPVPRFTRIDLDTALETFFQFSGTVFLVLPLMIMASETTLAQLPVLHKMFPVALILITIRLFIDCTYILDHDEQVLLYGRSIFGWVKTWKICPFRSIRRVGVEVIVNVGKSHTTYLYSLVIMLPNLTCIKVSEGSRSFTMVTGYGRWLARHFGCEFAEPLRGASSLESSGWEIPMEDVAVSWRTWPLIGSPGFWDIVIFCGAAVSTFLTLASFN